MARTIISERVKAVRIEALEPRTLLAAPALGGYQEMCAVGNTLYFSGASSTIGAELWKTDGTAAGTRLVKDVYAGRFGSKPNAMVQVDTTLYFRAKDKAGWGLWRSRGSADSTLKLRAGEYEYATRVGYRLFFLIHKQGSHELWVTDGTRGGTKLVSRNLPGTEPNEVVGGRNRLFLVYGGPQSRDVWISDGTAATTRYIARYHAQGSGGQRLFGLGDAMLFEASEGGVQQLWRCDAGGVSVIGPRSIGLESDTLIKAGLVAYYLSPGAGGTELWRTDGTAGGTGKVGDASTPQRPARYAEGNITAGAQPNLSFAGGRIFAFYSYYESHRWSTELWTIDPATAAMAKVAGWEPYQYPDLDYAGVSILEGCVVKDGIFFSVRDDPFGTPGVVFSDGTRAGTSAVASEWRFAERHPLATKNGNVFFIHDMAGQANRLWVWEHAADDELRAV